MNRSASDLDFRRPQPFRFPDTGQQVRVTMIDGEPWWVTPDVCSILGITNVGNVLSRLDAGDVGSIRIADGTPGNPNRSIVNESGLYDLILDSWKPEARAFRRLITSEVVPSIRKTGAYTFPQPKKQLTRLEMAEMLVEAEEARPVLDRPYMVAVTLLRPGTMALSAKPVIRTDMHLGQVRSVQKVKPQDLPLLLRRSGV